ncbi:MAG: hypothetical protein JNM28_13330 [Armatimonadetes bacterium]|nr:hypothetical protein [Armatimonadota bacterium]MBS1711475.1 hypothetical protein [Armatimonadota bacterium]MBX3107600.1 hypothetical protein [Fimbriimonadaceae bacterium]
MTRIALTVWALFGVMASGQAQSVSQVAERVENSLGTVRYAAVRVVRIRSVNGVREFEERVLRAGGKQYISYPPDSEYKDVKIYERDGKRYTYNRTTNEMRVAPSRAGASETVATLRSPEAANCTPRVGETVAGRKTIYIEIPAGKRGTHRLWIDAEKYVLLKRSFGSTQGDDIVGFEILKINFEDRFSLSKLDPPRDAKIITVADDVRRLAREMGLKPMMLARPGKLELVSAGQMEFRGKSILRQFYSDGERRVSLFLMQETSDQVSLPKSDRVHSYRWNAAGMTLVLIGDFTESELKQLSQFVKT